jgi:hypothetical protein
MLCSNDMSGVELIGGEGNSETVASAYGFFRFAECSMLDNADRALGFLGSVGLSSMYMLLAMSSSHAPACSVAVVYNESTRDA